MSKSTRKIQSELKVLNTILEDPFKENKKYKIYKKVSMFKSMSQKWFDRNSSKEYVDNIISEMQQREQR